MPFLAYETKFHYSTPFQILVMFLSIMISLLLISNVCLTSYVLCLRLMHYILLMLMSMLREK